MDHVTGGDTAAMRTGREEDSQAGALRLNETVDPDVCCLAQHHKSQGKHGREKDAYGSMRAEARTPAI